MEMDQTLAQLQAIWPNAAAAEEGGVTYYLLPELLLPEGCKPERTDALLYPLPRDGYPSRLYFASKIEGGPSRNWNGSLHILDRNWYAISWQTGPNLNPVQMVRVHLSAFKSPSS